MLSISHLRRARNGCPACGSLGPEGGITLIEVVTTIAILAIIIVPLTGATILGLKVADTTGANLQASVNRDLSSARWTEDVAAVDATGASRSAPTACRGSGGGTAEDLLVTLTSSDLDDATGATYVRRVSWWVAGVAPEIQIIRRVCSGLLDSLSLTNAAETVVAEDLGERGKSRSEVVSPADGPGSNPCTEFQCGLTIGNTEYPFNLRAQRRTFGAGVPLEIGRLYSSGYTRAVGEPQRARFRQAHVDINGVSGSVELPFANQLSLAPGLPGPSGGMNVEFKVRQVSTGKWLTRNGSNPPFTWTFDGSEGWVQGGYEPSTETWSVPLTTGSESTTTFAPGTVNAGGEYRVFTRLTEGTGPPKVYGGTNPISAGFPMWFDWRPETVVFVSPTGSDSNSGLPNPTTGIPEPVRTIVRGSTIARAEHRPEVLIQSGDYVGQVGLQPANTSSAGAAPPSTAGYTTLQGGLTPTGSGTAPGGWLRMGPKASGAPLALASAWQSAIAGSSLNNTTDAPTGIKIQGVQGLTIRQLRVRSGSIVGDINLVQDEAWSTYGVRASGGATFDMYDSDVVAEAPLNVPSSAIPATSGGPWVIACTGTRGAERSAVANDSRVPSTGPGLPAGSTAEPDCRPSNRTSGTGGGGGCCTGISFSSDGGDAGGSGQSISGGGASGAGGPGGPGSWCGDARNGQKGRGGGGGRGGLAAPSATFSTVPTAYAYGWVGGRSAAGQAGTPGGAGGGSGGGGENNCFFSSQGGRQGASGGNGGAAGVGGGGGLAGGSAIGVFLHGTGPVNLSATGVIAASGADGQRGGEGARGGNGGQGGQARSSAALGGESEGGGGGGAGGGGAGGNGGNGGHSIAIMYGTGAVPPTVDPVYLTVSNGGQGGAGGKAVRGLCSNTGQPPPGTNTLCTDGSSPGPAGSGGGGAGGLPSNVTFFFDLFNFSAGPGDAGGAATRAAADGRAGLTGQRCRVWDFGVNSVGGGCVLNAP